MIGQRACRRGARCVVLVAMLSVCLCASNSRAETILLIGPGGDVMPGTTLSVLVLLHNNTTNLVGYSLDMNVTAQDESIGSVTGNASASDFALTRNLIERDPDDSLHPVFSVIANAADGGVFLNAQSLSGNPVDLALPGFSDGLGTIAFDVSEDAGGRFEISLGPATVLFSGQQAVPFTANRFVVNVVPEPAAITLLAGMVALLRRRGFRGVGMRRTR